MIRHNQNQTHDIIADNFLHDLQTRHEPNTKLKGYGLRGLTHLIK
jgi:hypothetical protein